jgi:hypothetical protein
MRVGAADEIVDHSDRDSMIEDLKLDVDNRYVRYLWNL